MDFLEACGDIQLVDTVEQADFIIAHGSEIWLKRDQKEMKLGSFMSDGNFDVLGPLLEQCKTRNLPLVCANLTEKSKKKLHTLVQKARKAKHIRWGFKKVSKGIFGGEDGFVVIARDCHADHSKLRGLLDEKNIPYMFGSSEKKSWEPPPALLPVPRVVF